MKIPPLPQKGIKITCVNCSLTKVSHNYNFTHLFIHSFVQSQTPTSTHGAGMANIQVMKTEPVLPKSVAKDMTCETISLVRGHSINWLKPSPTQVVSNREWATVVATGERGCVCPERGRAEV